MEENGRGSRIFVRQLVVPYALILVPAMRKPMNQMPENAEEKSAAETTHTPEVAHPPSVRMHPRFTKPQRVAFVQSSWHRDVIEECRIAFLREIEERGIDRARIDLFEVPGSFEIPLHAQLLAKTRRYTAIVAAGLVIDDEYIAETVIKALMDVQLRTEIPIFSAVVTPQQFHETAAHFEFFRKHFATKGIEVAEACALTLHSLERLRGQVAAGIV
jgi:6,7-dimethyl-8-ribityllumazine synthase